MSVVKKPSIIRRIFRFIFFRTLPFLIAMGMILGIVGLGYGVAQAVARRVNEQSKAGERSQIYPITLTAILSTLTTNTPSPTATQIPSATPTATFTASLTATPTPSSTSTPTLTATLTASSTYTPFPTETPVPTFTSVPIQVAQVFATNTPRSVEVTIPALNTPVVSEPTLVSLTPTPLPTSTNTDLPTLTLTSLPAATDAPRPLPTLLLPPAPDANVAAPTAIPTQVPTVDRHGYDLVNILLLGGDDEITGDNITRTDTMIIVSLNRTTGTVSMLSLPRDLYVYIPGWTMQRINLAYTHGEQVGWTDGGFGLMRQTVFYNLGINVHYYILVNLSSFKEIIDSLGGVDVAVDCAIQDQELIDAPPPPEALGPDDNGRYVLPVGFYHLQGDGALWYARSRHNSSDFDRGRRQQQILRAIWRAARGSGQITQLPQLWSQLTEIVKTNLAFEDMLGLLPFALNLDPDRVDHFTMPKPYYTTPWTPPDGSNVQLPNYDHILELLEDFYQPPTESQVVVQGAQIQVFNGTSNPDWDRVAAERLAWGGFKAVSAGAADNASYTETILIDYTGQTKGSKLSEIAEILNVKPENIRVEPDPNRAADYSVILGSSYNSCTFGVLPVENAGD